MKIQHVLIHNFRSIADLELSCGGLLTLLGPNNHGKSNLLLAIEFALSSSAKPTPDDFFAFRSSDDSYLWVELTFGELTCQESTTFQKYLREDGTVRIRKTAFLTDREAVSVSYNGYVQEPSEIWLKGSEAGNYTSRASVSETPLADYVPDAGRLSRATIEDAQNRYIEEHRDELTLTETLEADPLLGQNNVAAGVLPDYYLVPAVKDLGDETKVKNTTVFGRLLNRAIQEMTVRDPRFGELRDQLAQLLGTLAPGSEERPEQLRVLESALEDELRQWGVSVEIDVNPPDIGRIFELGTDLRLNDGHITSADLKGHGLQRAVLFGLVRAWARVLRESSSEEGASPRRASETVIFAVEEPELFLHPHAQRSLAMALGELAERDNHQVLLSTHSTHFVNLARHRDICIVTKDSPRAGTSIRQCEQDLFEGDDVAERKRRFHMAHWVNPDRGEMFFARKVVFVEGETEKAIFPFLGEKCDCLKPEVSFIDCGSKRNLPLYIAIANAFCLQYVVVHDEDPVPDPVPSDWNADKLRESNRTFELNAEIFAAVAAGGGSVEVLSPDFEGFSGVSRSQGTRKGKALAALEHFEQLPTDELAPALRDLVERLFA